MRISLETTSWRRLASTSSKYSRRCKNNFKFVYTNPLLRWETFFTRVISNTSSMTLLSQIWRRRNHYRVWCNKMEWYGDIFWSKFSSTFCPSFHSTSRPHLSILTGWWGRLHRGSQLRQDRAQPRLLLPARDTQGKSWHMTYYTWWHMTHDS